MRLAAKSEEAIMSTESLQTEETLPTVVGWATSIIPAYYNGQLVAVKNVKKPFIVLNKVIIMEVNQVNTWQLFLSRLQLMLRSLFFKPM